MEECVFIINSPRVNKATWMLLSDDTKTLYRDFSSLIPTLFLPRAEEEMSLGMRQELECYFLFADTMAPISPDSATGDGPSFISLLDPRTGKVFFCNRGHTYTAFYGHLILWSYSQLLMIRNGA